MRYSFTVLLLFGFASLAFGQDAVVLSLVRDGVEYHDQGDYDNAIVEYKKALLLAPNSGLVNHEIALSYLSSGRYEEAIEHSKIAIAANDGNELVGYICYGNALAMSGSSNKSIKVYEKAMKEFDSYLLYYNHALACFDAGYLDKAYESALKAISNNPSHGGSHLILSKIMAEKGVRVKAVLPLYFFLLLEPNSLRSTEEYKTLREYLSYGVSNTSRNSTNVLIPESNDPYFGAVELMISLSKASNSSKEETDKNELELFTENNENIFSILGELKKGNSGFWWDFYVSFFADIQTKGYTETYSYYISQSLGDISANWLKENQEELKRFVAWINEG